MLYLIFAIIPSFFLYEPRELIQFLEYFIHSSETQWHTVRTDDSVFPLLLLVEDSIFHSHPGPLVNQSWLILPLVETWWFGRHSSRLRRYNLNGFSVATAGIDWNGSRSGAVIFSDRWTNAELAPRWIRGNDFSVASIASFSAVRWLIRVTNLHGIGWRIGLSIYDSF